MNQVGIHAKGESKENGKRVYYEERTAKVQSQIDKAKQSDELPW